jgi:hypothetical protein
MILNIQETIGISSIVILLGGLIVYWVMAFFILYHLIRFGVGTKPKQLSFVFLAGSIILTIFCVILFFGIG